MGPAQMDLGHVESASKHVQGEVPQAKEAGAF
jgi:hypothetical protein